MECNCCGQEARAVVKRGGADWFLCNDCARGIAGGQGRSGADTFRLGEAFLVLAVVAALLLGVVWALGQRDQKPLEPVVGGRP